VITGGVSVQTIIKYRIRSHTRHNGHVSVGYVLARLERHLDLKDTALSKYM